MKKENPLPNEANRFAETAADSRLFEAVSIILRRKWLIGAITSGVVILGIIILLFLPKRYDSVADVLLERLSDTEKAMLFQVSIPNVFDKYDWINAEVQIIKSRPVAEQVISAIGLDHFGTDDLPIDENALRIVREETIEKLREDIRVGRLSNSNVLRVRYESFDPNVAQRVLDQIIASYREYRTNLFRETEAFEFYSKQVKEADDRLRQLEAKQSGFKGNAELVEPKSQGDLLLNKLADYQTTLNNVQTQRIGKEARLAIIQDKVRIAKEFSIPATEISDSPSRADYLARLKTDLLELQLQRDDLLRKYSPTYSDIVEIENKIRSAEEKFLSEIEDIIAQEETSIRVFLAQETRLRSAMDSVRTAIQQLSEQDYELAQISRGIEDTRELYSMLLRQRENARLSMEKAQRGVRVLTLSPPTSPIHHTRPQRRIGVMISLFLGLCLGIGAAFVLEFVRKFSTDENESELSTIQRVTAALLEQERIPGSYHKN